MELPLSAISRSVTDRDLLSLFRNERSASEIAAATGVAEADVLGARSDYLARRLPAAEATLTASTNATVEILRDRAWVPHVFAGSTADLWFGVGFAMAQDRLWQMDRLRRRALGTLAEVLGPDHAAADLQHRIVDLDGIAAAEAQRLDGEERVVVEALVAGINRGIESFGAELPVEFAILGYEPAPFTSHDVLAILRGIWWSLNGRLPMLTIAEAASLLPEELRAAYLTPASPEARILPAGSPVPPAGMAPDPLRPPVAGESDWQGSNNWAVGAGRTAAGQPILCSDPHQPFWLPSSWYEFAIHGPEGTVAGAGHPGTPGQWWGSNGSVAWGITNDGTSTKDLYREEVHPDDPGRYRDGDGWRAFDERAVEIAVRGEEPRRHTVRSTVRGPIVNEVVPPVDPAGDPPLSLRWVGQEHVADVATMLRYAKAKSCGEFQEALREWAIPVFNWVCADTSGQVAYQHAGRIPIRGRIKSGYRDATNPDDAWQGYVPFDAMPRIAPTRDGYVSSANNRPYPDDYPYPLYGPSATGYRQERIREVIDAARPFDLGAAWGLQNDPVSRRAAHVAPLLVARLHDCDDPEVDLFVAQLRDWDFAYTFDATAPLFFETFSTIWSAMVAEARFPAHLQGLVKGQTGPATRLIEGEDLAWFQDGVGTKLVDAARETVRWIKEHHGEDPAGWRWREIHKADWKHPLSTDGTADLFDLGPEPILGCAETVNNTGTGTGYDVGVIGGVEYRLLVDFAEPGIIRAVQNAGNSGQPGSPHYGDQLAPWIAGEYHTVHLSREGVEEDLAGKTVLRPEG